MNSGCQSTLTTRLDKAAIATAAARQAPNIPDYPDRCREHFKMPRDPMGGEQWVAWRGRVHIAAAAIDSQIDGCAAWWDDVKAGLAAPLRVAK
jgi:hypothetical protein